ncbi:hypothetical protein IFR05_002856 [Cadophora sp. M221]|nr:hypothetical protein IFR05_002856 [Cadophora sp. M221]
MATFVPHSELTDVLIISYSLSGVFNLGRIQFLKTNYAHPTTGANKAFTNPLPKVQLKIDPTKAITPTINLHVYGDFSLQDSTWPHSWIPELIEHAELHASPFHPVISEFQQLIRRDPMLYMAFKHIFKHTSHEHLCFTNGSRGPSASSSNQVLVPCNELLIMPPTICDSGFVANTLGGLLELLTGTPQD